MNPKRQPISPSMTKDLVLSKCDYFIDVQLWPLHNTLNYSQWLENFRDTEMEHAVSLLNSFLYFSDALINQMFIAAFHGLCNKIGRTGDSSLTPQVAWRSFIDSVIVTLVTGEDPNISDSSFGFARKARQQLGIKESQLKNQESCLRFLVERGPRPVIFVDDFVGCGNQLVETWERIIKLNNSTSISFKNISTMKGSSFFYCPLLCTEYGYKRLQIKCPEVMLTPAHILSSEYSALVDDSIIWPAHLRKTAVDFLYQVSKRAGIPENGDVNDWRGFHKLGLAIAFAHSVPDATMPIFYWEKNGWKPLIKKS